MKTQLKTEVKGIELELSLGEALVFLKDPSRVQAEVRSMLKIGGIKNLDNPSKEKKESPGLIKCPDCGAMVKGKRGLKYHQSRYCQGRSKNDT